MSDDVWRRLAATAGPHSDAIRFACILEATAPKVGNVHPAARFADLSYIDFVTAADITAEALSGPLTGGSWTAAMGRAVVNCVAATQTNVNLGIVLLLAPLVASEPDWPHPDPTSLADRCARWQTRIAPLLSQLDFQQGAEIARAISAAGAGGLSDESLGDDHPLDVQRDNIAAYDIMEAMRVAAPRDRVAKQYAHDFRDLFDVVVPTLQHCVATAGDLLTGIVHAHIALIAADGDSLIARKCGAAEAARVARLAEQCWHTIEQEAGAAASAAVRNLDKVLRSRDNRLNPGTSADLIAAAIYVLLRVSTVGDNIQTAGS